MELKLVFPVVLCIQFYLVRGKLLHNKLNIVEQSHCALSGSIHKNLKYFETIHADDLVHKIVKRGLQDSDHPYNKIKEVYLNTHGKDFRLILSPKRSILHSNFKAYAVDGDGEETHIPIGQLPLSNYINS